MSSPKQKKKIPNILAKLAEFTISKLPHKTQIFLSKKMMRFVGKKF
jgi:hypothetical protein